MASNWRSYKPGFSNPLSAQGDSKTSALNSPNSNGSSSALSRSSGLYSRRFDTSSSTGKRSSPVLSGYRGKTRHNSETNADGTMHPAARTLNKRAASVERLFPLRSSHLPSKSESNGDTSDYSRSSLDSSSLRYGGSGSDLSRIGHSKDYTKIGSTGDRLDEDRMSDNYHYGNSSHDLSSSNHSGGGATAYQNGMSPQGRSNYSYEEVERLKADYQKQLQDIKLDYQSKILAKDRDWDKKLQACKSELNNSHKIVTELRQRCNQMAEEYDKSMTELLNDRELAAQSGVDVMSSSVLSSDTVKTLKMERDQYAEDLQQVEKSFTELHKRYDKLRGTTQNQKQTEEKLKAELKDLRRQLQDSAVNFNKVRHESQQKLSKAASEVEKTKTSCKAEIVRLQMALKKSELQTQSLELQLQQKASENTELAQICDNLIALKSADQK